MNTQFGNIYSKYYDLLYKDKPYEAEIEFVVKTLKKYGFENYTSLLDLGCGTGKHLVFFSKYFKNCYGIDISEGMIKKAKTASEEYKNINFKVDDISNFKIKRKFSCIISLFHVFSYLTSEQKINGFLKCSNAHSEPGSFLFFDYYNYDGLMKDRLAKD